MKNTLVCIFLFLSIPLFAEDGSRLWLRYEPLPELVSENYQQIISNICPAGSTETARIIEQEFVSAFENMTGRNLKFSKIITTNSLVFEIDTTIQSGYFIQTD